MATTLREISKFLHEEGLKHSPPEDNDYIQTGFKTENYRNVNGDNNLTVIIKLEESGEFIKVLCPFAYKCTKNLNSYHRLSLFQTLLQISWMSKMVQFEYDPDDGEIRPIIEFPLEDAKLTRRQICRCLHAIAQIIDKHHESIIDALSHGITPETPKANIAAYEEFLSQRRETRRRELSPVQQPISHLETSIHAPSNSTGPGTSPDNPFILKSIIECYALLNAMHMRTDHGLIKVRYDRVGPVQSNRFPYPIDHYILFESAPFSDKRLGKLMDFYMYGYGSRSMSLDLLPNGLGDMMVGSSPKEKSKMESLIDKIFGKKSDR